MKNIKAQLTTFLMSLVISGCTPAVKKTTEEAAVTVSVEVAPAPSAVPSASASAVPSASAKPVKPSAVEQCGH